jgi:hypothetical protein
MTKITIEYLLADETEFKTVEVPIEDYFDLDQGEKISIDSVPKFAQPYEYITSDTSKIMQLNLKVQIENDKIEFKQTFWNDGQNMLTERTDTGKNNYNILSLCINKEQRIDEVIRLVHCDNKIYPIHHSFISTDKNGVEEETIVDLSLLKKRYYKENP